jgi:hypothetical protein
MKRVLLGFAAVALTVSAAHAVMIGFFPGLDELIKKADAIVILRVDHHVDAQSNPTLYTTHDCYVYQTLKGNIPTNRTVRLQLMDTRTSFATPFALHSTHLMYLTKKRSPDEPTEFRTIEFRGANVRLPPTGHESAPVGKTIADQIRSVLRRAAEQNKKDHDKRQSFLTQMIKGTAEQKN